jgi:hypothetical protein
MTAKLSCVRRAAIAVTAAATIAVVPAGPVLAGPSSPFVATAPAGPCDDIDPGVLSELPVLGALEEVDALSSFSAAVVAAGLDPSQGGPFTVFAATNDAIEAIPQNVFDTLLADQDLLASLISYHVVAGRALTGGDLVELGSIDTLNGPVAITMDGTTMRVNEANVLCAEIVVADAVIFVIDRVLQPAPEVAGGCPGSTVSGSSVPGSSVPGSSVPGSSVPC